MSCEEKKDKCKFCGREIKIREYYDPIHIIYDCDSCGKYILLEEIYNYIAFPSTDFLPYFHKLKPIFEKLKIKNSKKSLKNVIFAIGRHTDVDNFKKSDYVTKQHQGINWQFLTYSDLLKSDGIVES